MPSCIQTVITAEPVSKFSAVFCLLNVRSLMCQLTILISFLLPSSGSVQEIMSK